LNWKTAIALFFMLILLVTSFGLVLAQTYIPGVMQGDVFSYDLKVSYTSNNLELESPEENYTATFRIEINQVLDKEVKYSCTLSRSGDITTFNKTAKFNLDPNGEDNLYIIPSGLNSNDQYPFYGGSQLHFYTINETILQSYAEETRQTNHMSFDVIGYPGTLKQYNQHLDMYFDRESGIMVKYINQIEPTVDLQGDNSKATTREEMNLVYSSQWAVKNTVSQPTPEPSIPEFPELIIIAAFIVILSASAIIIKVKNKKQR
jgi:hypothetical protein